VSTHATSRARSYRERRHPAQPKMAWCSSARLARCPSCSQIPPRLHDDELIDRHVVDDVMNQGEDSKETHVPWRGDRSPGSIQH
jgi:hypothetical protein